MSNYIDIGTDELDRYIYRIMSIERLIEAISSKQLALVRPDMWDDPFENWLLSADVTLASTGEVASLASIREKIAGQCWTMHRETDAMWRIYSPNKDGVKVRTTIRKLYESLASTDPRFNSVTCFIGKVQYHYQKDLPALLKAIDLFASDGKGIATSLLFKRKEFSHENEVRLLYTEAKNKIHKFEIDPEGLFEEALFDPRMDEQKFVEARKELRDLGYKNRVEMSSLYQLPSKLKLVL
jgi:hypothetical protein